MLLLLLSRDNIYLNSFLPVSLFSTFKLYVMMPLKEKNYLFSAAIDDLYLLLCLGMLFCYLISFIY